LNLKLKKSEKEVSFADENGNLNNDINPFIKASKGVSRNEKLSNSLNIIFNSESLDNSMEIKKDYKKRGNYKKGNHCISILI